MVLFSSSYRGKCPGELIEILNVFLGLIEHQEQRAVLCEPQSLPHHLERQFIPVTIPLIVSHLLLINAHYRLFPLAPLSFNLSCFPAH